jgi:hypothetical protein
MQSIIIRWENWRFWFNLALLAVGLLTTYSEISTSLDIYTYVFGVIRYGLLVNVFYNLGPFIDIYFKAWNIDIGVWRNVLFTVGLSFSVLITLLLGLTLGWPAFD